jgi:hypothetical protein
MFVGHFGVALAAKRVDAKPSLGTVFLAAQFIDLLWPLFLILGIENVKIEPGITSFAPLNFVYYPFSHSLLAVIIWSVLFCFGYFFVKKNLRSAIILGVLVASHWFLDLIVHRPDLPLFIGDDVKVGFGLWYSVAGTLLLELFIFALGIFLYYSSTTAKNKTGEISFWSLIVFLLIIYFMNVFGPPPPQVEAIGYLGLSQWLLIAWGYWIDRNRISGHLKLE